MPGLALLASTTVERVQPLTLFRASRIIAVERIFFCYMLRVRVLASSLSRVLFCPGTKHQFPYFLAVLSSHSALSFVCSIVDRKDSMPFTKVALRPASVSRAATPLRHEQRLSQSRGGYRHDPTAVTRTFDEVVPVVTNNSPDLGAPPESEKQDTSRSALL